VPHNDYSLHADEAKPSHPFVFECAIGTSVTDSYIVLRWRGQDCAGRIFITRQQLRQLAGVVDTCTRELLRTRHAIAVLDDSAEGVKAPA